MDALNDNIEDENARILNQLLLSASEGDTVEKDAECKLVAPKPGFCLKTKDETGKKVFINICHSEQIPEAADASDDKLIELMNSDEPGSYRIPMSLGEPHAEVDNSGQGCTAYDVVVHPQFLLKMNERRVVMSFFLTVVMEGLESKYSLSLSRDWKILKNRKFVGTMPDQNIRTKSKPFIMEMDSDLPKKPLISEIPESSQESNIKALEPAYSILQEPPAGHPEFLVAELQLPSVKSIDSVQLDIGEDRLLLQTRAQLYYLDIYLPYNLIQEDCGAQFNAKSKILTVTMPVQPVS